MEESPAYIESGCDDPLREWHGLRFGGWKYAEHPRWSPNVEAEPTLFDLADDPDERRNVVHKYPDRAIEMRKRLDEIVYSRIDQSPAGQELSDDEQAQLAEQLKALGYI